MRVRCRKSASKFQRIIILFPPRSLLVPLFPRSITIKNRSHVPASRLSIVQRSSRVSRFSHKTRGTTFDRRQSAIIIRVPSDLPQRLGACSGLFTIALDYANSLNRRFSTTRKVANSMGSVLNIGSEIECIRKNDV